MGMATAGRDRDFGARVRPGPGRRGRIAAAAGCALLGLLLPARCISDGGAGYRSMIQSERPHERMRAIHRAGELRDPQAVALLVDRLEDDDAGVRFYALLALERITGERFGYDYAASAPERAAAVARWREFARSRYAAGASPATPGIAGGSDR